MKFRKDAESIKANLDMLAELNEIQVKENDLNLYIVNTPKGQIKIKSKLEYNEFVKSIKKQ